LEAIKSLHKALFEQGYPDVLILHHLDNGDYYVLPFDAREVGVLLNETHQAVMKMRVERAEWRAICQVASDPQLEFNYNGDNQEGDTTGRESGNNNSGLDVGESGIEEGGSGVGGELSGSDDSNSEADARNGG